MDHALVLGDVAGRIDPGRRGPQPGVDRDSAVAAQLDPGGARQHHVGHRARAHDHRVSFDPVALLGDDVGDAAVGALKAVELVVAVHGDPVLLEAVLEEASGALAEPATEDDPLEHHHRAGAPELGERRGDFAGDIGAADQHHPLAGRVLADRVAVPQRPQVVDPVELRSGHVQPAHVGAGGEQAMVEADRLAGGQRHHALRGVELHRRHPGERLDPLLLVRTRAAGTAHPPALSLPCRYPLEHGGRLYGRSSSRPISRIDPSAPDSRSHRAQLPAARPPADQRVVDVAVRHSAAVAAGLGELGRDLGLEPRIEDQQHLVAGLDHGVGLRHEPGAAAQHRDDQRAVGQRDVLDLAAGRGRSRSDLDLDDLEVLLLQRQQLDQPVLGDLVLDQPQDQVGRRDRRLDRPAAGSAGGCAGC